MRTVLFLLSLLGVAEALAQAPAAEDAPVALSAISAFGVEMGQPLRVTRGEQLFEGRLVEVDERSFTLLAPDNSQSERVFFTDVRQLSVLKSSPGRGALIGAGVGFVGGVVLGTHLSSLVSDYSSFLEDLAFGGLVGSAFALPGAGIGALIGLGIPHWEQVYDRQPPAELRGPRVPSGSRQPWRGKGAVITFDVGSLFLR
jgi:hypothetical protein